MGHARQGASLEGIVVKERIPVPFFLYVNEDGAAEVRRASLWGRGAAETAEPAKGEVGDPAGAVVTIGEAGGKQVAIACLAADGHSFTSGCGGR